MSAQTRDAVFAGSWYPGDPDELAAVIDDFLSPAVESPRRVTAAVAPHAGVMHSGPVAGRLFAAIEVPRRVVVLCPNHRDARPDRPIAAVAPHDAWRTPLGEIPISRELSEALVVACPIAGLDAPAHEREHAVELILPFLQRRRPDLELCALTVASTRPEDMAVLGAGLAQLLALDDPPLLVASSDMTHFEPRDVVAAKDRLAIDRVLDFDPDGLLATCRDHGISMCGRGPTAAILHALRASGRETYRAELVATGHSRSRPGEDSVVGYASLLLEPVGA